MRSALYTLLCAAALSGHAAGWDLGGFAESELRVFPQSPRHAGQDADALHLSFALQPELFHEWKDSGWRLQATPFFRWDEADPERTHFDLRELFVQNRFDDLELSVGIRKIFWGVTESVHLVDSISQTDLVENIDEEDRLGQPMVQLSYATEAGTFELLALPYFRERTFAGRHGRLRQEPSIDTDAARYESSAEQWHFDLAARYSVTYGRFDLGLYHFYGTNREPTLLPGRLGPQGDLRSLIPYYEIVHQTGLDLQYTKDSWLLKLEALSRSGQDDWFWAAAGGFEYTFFDVADSGLDLGLLAEYLFESRPDRRASIYQDDIFAGIRLGFNDTKDTHILAGAIVDRAFGSTILNLEASRRIGENWTIYTELRAFPNVDDRDPLSGIERDSYLQFSLRRYF